MKQFFVVASIGLAAFIAGCSGEGGSAEPEDSGAAVQPAGSSDATASVTPVSGTAEVVFHVPGMVWPGSCKTKVVKALESLPGVANVEIDFPAKMATCQIDPNGFDKQAAFTALEKVGFPATEAGDDAI